MRTVLDYAQEAAEIDDERLGMVEELLPERVLNAMVLGEPGGPVAVVMPEAWEAAIDGACRAALPFLGAPEGVFDDMSEDERGSHRVVVEAQLHAALALIPGIEFAEAVGFVCEDASIVDCDDVTREVGGPNDRVAVLRPKEVAK